MSEELIASHPDYLQLLQAIKAELRQGRLKAAVAVSRESLKVYWNIGQQIRQQQQKTQWGDHFLETLSLDLRHAFPETRGFSVSNLKRMRLFAQLYPELKFGSQPVSQLPWGQVAVLMHKVSDSDQRAWYAQQAFEEGWSRPTLEKAIARNLYQQQAVLESKTSNFLEKLPDPQSSLALEIIKNPYNFDFLGLHDAAQEREIEHGLTTHITKFLLELGKGFAFVGRQVPLQLNEEEYFIDMLFYHLKLHCYVVVELKATKFKPEHAGQLNFYLNLVDDFVRTPIDNPSIGLLLCKSHDKFMAEYALKGIDKPVGVSEYQLTKAIPESFKTDLPTISEIEAQLNQLKMAESEK